MGILSWLFGHKQQNESFDSEEYNRKNQAEISKAKTLYDMNSLEGIDTIPVPIKKQMVEPSSVVVQLEYILQRKATEHKKNGDMDLAIACLEKSNQIMPFSWFSYSKKDYERLVEFLKQAGKFDEARAEQKKIDKVFGEDTIPIIDRERIRSHSRSGDADLVHVLGHLACCSECAKYRDRVYSLSGNSRKYPKYPQYFIDNPDCCGFSEYPFHDGISSMWNKNYKDVDPVKYSNRPFKDDRTAEEKQHYEEAKEKFIQEGINRKNYDWIREYLPDKAPKSYGGYVRMRNSRSRNYLILHTEAMKHNIDLDK